MSRLSTVVLAAAVSLTATRAEAQFDHATHGQVFPLCVTCHEGARDPSRPVWPDPASCTTCHDGSLRPAVSWVPPVEPRRENLRFSHATHPDTARGGTACTACHTEPGGARMNVRLASVSRCLSCHGITTAHLDAPAAACATCHEPLARASLLTRADIARFPVPPSHRERGFGGAGHAGPAVAQLAACATCHARDFCASCHVDAPENRTIQALAEDPRSLAVGVTLRAPATHRAADFLRAHRNGARRDPTQCATCHTRESCANCHQAEPMVAAALPAAGPGRGPGAILARRQPPSHVPGFRDRHGATAAALPSSCDGCHARSQCTDCHRPGPASAPRGYHPGGFLERHPAAAYGRETSCSDCHNAGSFCSACHRQAGLMARAPLGSGYHDAKQLFILGHGVAARQSLESCVSCHTERTCLSCHSALGGRRFNPHGPGFDARQLARKNPEVCLACHGTQIPGVP